MFMDLNPTFNIAVAQDGTFEPYAISQVSDLKTSTIDEMKTNATIRITPNPSSNKTTINWYNAQDQHVNISLLNLHGQYIETMVSEDFKAGQQSFDWYTSHLPRGIYFVRSKAGENTATQKLIIMK